MEWVLVEGPRGASRAVERRAAGARRAAFVVPAAFAPLEDIVLARLPDRGGDVVVARRGLCTLRELMDLTAAQHAFLDVDVALDLIVRSGKQAGDVFDIDRVEICDDGEVVAFAGPVRVDDARTIMDALSLLVCDSLDPDRVVDTLSQRYSRRTLETFVLRAPRWSIDAFCTRLADLMIDTPPPPSQLGAVVAHLFPERLAAERAFDEQVAMLDDAALDSLSAAAAARSPR